MRTAEPEEPEVYYAHGELKAIAENTVQLEAPQNDAIVRWGAWRRRLLSCSSFVQGEWIEEWM
jgi:hypothetical protein